MKFTAYFEKNIMKKIIGIAIVSMTLFSTKLSAQISKGNVLVGGDIAGLNYTLGGGGAFTATINPKAAFFIKDNTALGAYINFGLQTAKGAGTTITYGAGALARYYISNPDINLLKEGRLFFEGNVGVQGVDLANGSNTTGLGFGVGPGYAYFVTPNIGLETLLKYNGIVGFGSQPYNDNLSLNVGFQVYLGHKRIKTIINNVQ